MAITTLDTGGSSGETPDGTLWSWTYVVDYDSTAKTVGLTVTGQAADNIVTVTNSKGSWTINTKKGVIGDFVNAGRRILLGPGSVIGQTAPVASQPTGTQTFYHWSS